MAEILFVEATYHIGLCSRNKFEHNQFSRSQDIEARYARAHVHSELTPHGHGRVEAT